MVSTVDTLSTMPLVSHPLPQAVGEKRVVFHGLNWQQFLTIRDAFGLQRNRRLTYDQGTLEITMPLHIHEFSAELIGLFIRILVVELGMNLVTVGSTTLDKEALDRSAQPDKAYYIQNKPVIANQTIDLEQGLPPDVVVEVDITHTDIDKISLYAAMGIPEFWRYNGETWRIYSLKASTYEEVSVSPTFPSVSKDKLYEFLAAARQNEVQAEKSLRGWVRSQIKDS